MPDTSLAVTVNGTLLDATGLAAVTELQVEEAVDLADALTVHAEVKAGSDGSWTSVLDALTTPRAPVQVDIQRGSFSYRFVGASVEAEWKLSNSGHSTLVVKALDRTLELDHEEKVTAWSGMADSAVAQAIFRQYGMQAQVDDTAAGLDPDVLVVIQRGTDWAFLRSLAARSGYDVYLESTPSGTVGHFRLPNPLDDPQGELALGYGGAGTNIVVKADLVAGRQISAARIPPLSETALSGSAAGVEHAQGQSSLGGQSVVLLAPTDLDGELDLTRAATGLADRSAMSLTLTADIDVTDESSLLHARRPVLVRGLGTSLSGRWDVDRVRHRIQGAKHQQHVTLRRNAFGLKGDEPFTTGSPTGGLTP